MTIETLTRGLKILASTKNVVSTNGKIGDDRLTLLSAQLYPYQDGRHAVWIESSHEIFYLGFLTFEDDCHVLYAGQSAIDLYECNDTTVWLYRDIYKLADVVYTNSEDHLATDWTGPDIVDTVDQELVKQSIDEILKKS